MNQKRLDFGNGLLGRSPRFVAVFSFVCFAVFCVLFWAADAHATSSSAGEEYLSTYEAAPPNIMFLLDLSAAMDDGCDDGSATTGYTYTFDADVQPIFDAECASCHDSTTLAGDLDLSGDAYDDIMHTASTEVPGMNLIEGGDSSLSYLYHKIAGTHSSVYGTGDSMPPSGSLSAAEQHTIYTWIEEGAPGDADLGGCIENVVDAIDQVSQHYDWARYGVIGTPDGHDCSRFLELVPLGSTHAELSAALDEVEVWDSQVRNLGESLAWAAGNYFNNTTTDNGEDDDGDGFTGDWAEAPIQYYCQDTHVITITTDQPNHDGDPFNTSTWVDSISPDISCEPPSGSASTDLEECYYDNIASAMYETDFRSDLSGDQNVIVHTLSIAQSSGSVADQVYGNASDQTGGEGIYYDVDDTDDVLSGILLIMQDIRSGYYSRSSPVISTEGDYLIYSFYELTGDNPLGEGHLRTYGVDNDPTSSSYGQIEYETGSPYDDWGGALWDAGPLLASRPAEASEQQVGDNNGFGTRDIYTFVEEMYGHLASEVASTGRMGLDYDFANALVGYETTTLTNFLDTSRAATGCAEDMDYDLDGDGCDVDTDDLQALIDFTRGVSTATYPVMGLEHGSWKLGDAPHSTPVIVTARNNNFSLDPTYRAFLEGLEDDEVPSMVFQANNDGMLHAYFLEDDSATAGTEQGEEAWAWVPAYLLYKDHDAEWAGRLIDQMHYGRTFLFDGTPVVEDVWIDEDGDGAKASDGSEWRRVLVVQQGKGGPVTLALDISNTQEPEFLWEQADESDASAIGYTVGRPVVANFYDGDEGQDHWTVVWGSGRAVPYSSDTAYYKSTEASLYFWAVGDDYWDSMSVGYEKSNTHPEGPDGIGVFSATELDSDGDGFYEYGYISAAIAAVDTDSDGDIDVMYFPITTTYGASVDGGELSDVEDPGSTWMYKAVIDNDDVDDPTWCEFYDAYGDIGSRPAVYYAATAAWMTDGTLGVYYGTGTPYDRDSSDPGYFFAVRDSEPLTCTSGGPGSHSTGALIEDCGAAGVYELDDGEGLTGDPLVYAGTVFFSTYVPDDDRCEIGEGRLYGIDYEDCSPALDTNGDGVVDDDDDPYTEVDGYPSAPVVSESGHIYVGGSNSTGESGDSGVQVIETSSEAFLGTSMITWAEIY